MRRCILEWNGNNSTLVKIVKLRNKKECRVYSLVSSSKLFQILLLSSTDYLLALDRLIGFAEIVRFYCLGNANAGLFWRSSVWRFVHDFSLGRLGHSTRLAHVLHACVPSCLPSFEYFGATSAC